MVEKSVAYAFLNKFQSVAAQTQTETQTLEKHFKKAHATLCSAAPNLRLGSINFREKATLVTNLACYVRVLSNLCTVLTKSLTFIPRVSDV